MANSKKQAELAQTRARWWRLSVSFATIAVGILFFVWQPWKVQSPELFPEFLMFPSARSFDPPGTVFRISPDGTRYDVTDISKSINSAAGEEFIPDESGRRRISGDSIARALGENGSMSLTFSGQYDVTLKLAKVRREKTSDIDIDKVLALRLSQVQLRRESRYYIIRETIAAKEIDYTLSASDSSTLASKLKVKDAEKGDVKIERSGSGETRLVGRYEAPARIFYKLEEVKFEAHGINGALRISRIPVQNKSLVWREASRGSPQTGRGRDASYLTPPAQIRTCSTVSAHGFSAQHERLEVAL